LLTAYFKEHPHDNLPSFADKYIVFRRGVGIDRTTDYFVMEKVDVIISRVWRSLLSVTRIDRLFSKKPQSKPRSDIKKTDEIIEDSEEQELFVERIRLEKIELRLIFLSVKFGRVQSDAILMKSYLFHNSIKNLTHKMTIQEPTFDRMIVVYR
jgi:hypothetical protein